MLLWTPHVYMIACLYYSGFNYSRKPKCGNENPKRQTRMLLESTDFGLVLYICYIYDIYVYIYDIYIILFHMYGIIYVYINININNLARDLSVLSYGVLP